MVQNPVKRKRILSAVLIIVIFLIFVLAYFYFFQYLGGENSRFHQKQVARYENQMIKSDLSFNQDAGRFLQVYFNQEFQQADKNNFIRLEYQRFLDYSFVNQAEQELGLILTTNLEKIIEKINSGQTNFFTEESELKKLQGRLK